MDDNMRRLHPRGAASRGICVDAEGAMLGPDCVLVRCTPNGFRAIERDAASTVQKCLVGAHGDRDWLFHRCQHIADLLDKGHLALAQIYGLHMPIGDLDDLRLKQLARVRFAKAGFNPDEPRIPEGDHGGGEWTTGDAIDTAPNSNVAPSAVPLRALDVESPDTDGSPPMEFRIVSPDSDTAPHNAAPESSSSSEAGITPSIPNGDRRGDESTVHGEADGNGGLAGLLTDVAFRGVYHNLVVAQIAAYMRGKGATVITEVDLIDRNGVWARADIIAVRTVGGPLLIIEVKTGNEPRYTPRQKDVYPMAQIGDHVFSPNSKIEVLGFSPGQWLPPMTFATVYKRDEKSDYVWWFHPVPFLP